MPKFLSNIDLFKNELQNARIQNLATEPEQPLKGQVYYNTSEDTFFIFAGETKGWLDLAKGQVTREEFESLLASYNEHSADEDIHVDASQSAALDANVGLGADNKVVSQSDLDDATVQMGDDLDTHIADDSLHVSQDQSDALDANTTLSLENAVASLQEVADAEQAAKDHADTETQEVQTNLDAHIGSGGITEHPLVTELEAGFISPEDKGELDSLKSHANEHHSVDFATINGDYVDLRARATTQEDLGLDRVENKSSADIRSELTPGDIIEGLEFTPEDSANKGQPDGYASLDSAGEIPNEQLPAVAKFKMFIVEDDVERDALEPAHGDKAFLLTTGSTFVWDENADDGAGLWRLQSDTEFEDITIYWDTVQDKPTEFTPEEHGNEAHSTSYITKYAEDIGDGATNTFVIDHNLDSRDVQVTVRENAAPFEQVFTDVKISGVNSAEVSFATAPEIDEFRVIVVG